MGCPWMKDPENAARIRQTVAGATPEQRVAARPHAVQAAKAPTPRDRANAVVQWLKALGQCPRGWLFGRL